ncbi:MAG: 23S rRNA (adenine(2503)-C(2))-methyltransferase RlmN [Nitrospirae bacterium]|nr:23S rRNA (adenine(2503)-C(2))-methyltransferase RlmN [Candidatus Troglogloeales bacterium]MBI3598607.1 23S rRNA (adenine(2503)-C(2))-methyltransferase RlmN [Candidatus Troglogloeales bacterium]
MIKQNLLALSFDEIESFVIKIGFKKYRAKQILSWIYQKQVKSMDEMTDLSLSDRALLSEKAALLPLKIITRQKSSDGTEKFLLGLEDGNKIESVFLPEEKRLTLCISTQAGCTLDCTFCLTAIEKLKRNLKVSEIIGQVLTVQREHPERRITNIVFMGMGEPLANLSAVTEAVGRMISPIGFSISPRKITVSTAGLAPQINQFLTGPTQANLSISLNATTDAVRNQIMPKVNKLYPIKVLLEALRKTPLPSRRRVTFEYVLLAGVNDSIADAVRLVRLSHGIRCKINLIPFNEFPEASYRRPSDDQIEKFQKTLLKGGLVATLRKNRGQDILAACGQLSGENKGDPP